MVALALLALALHGLAGLGLSGHLTLRLPTETPLQTGPLQTRWVPEPALALASPPPRPAPQNIARSRIATEPKTATAPAMTDTLAEATDAANPTAATTPPSAAENPPEASTQTAQAAPVAAAAAPASAPLMPLGPLPSSTLMNYRLTGVSKGLTYHASGELRWQANDSAYAMSLSVKAFLIGTRHWRSTGAVTAAGLAPKRFSDSWRSERAAHFDRDNHQVVFSNNAPVAPLAPGAQDQISLYVQLAAAMAGEPQRYEPGTQLSIQTITTRDALPWLLTLASAETLTLPDQTLPTRRWVAQPRHRYDATVEFWTAEKYAWMPVRIRITQVGGDHIDLMLSGQEALPPLPATGPSPGKTTPS